MKRRIIPGLATAITLVVAGIFILKWRANGT